jgi:hypothetical protein
MNDVLNCDGYARLHHPTVDIPTNTKITIPLIKNRTESKSSVVVCGGVAHFLRVSFCVSITAPS